MPDCWKCKHAKGTEETFYEYGEESAKGECGTNYGVECGLGLKQDSKECLRTCQQTLEELGWTKEQDLFTVTFAKKWMRITIQLDTAVGCVNIVGRLTFNEARALAKELENYD